MDQNPPKRTFSFSEDEPKPNRGVKDFFLFMALIVGGVAGFYLIKNQDRVRFALGLSGPKQAVTGTESAQIRPSPPRGVPPISGVQPAPAPVVIPGPQPSAKDPVEAGLKQGMSLNEVREIMGPPESATELGSMVQMDYPGGVRILLNKENRVVGWSKSK